MKILLKIFAWLIVSFFIIMSISAFAIHGFGTAIAFLCAGILILPIRAWKNVKSKMKIKGITTFILAVVLFFVGCLFLPETNTSDNSVAAEQENISNRNGNATNDIPGNTSSPNSNSSSASISTPPTLNLLFHEPYLDAVKIEPHFKSKRHKLISEIETALNSDPIPVDEEAGGLFDGNDYFAATNRLIGDFYYYGETKDNRPDGFGVLTSQPVNLENLESLIFLVYAGDFKDGRFDGYGAKFNNSDAGRIDVVVSNLIEKGLFSEADAPLLTAYYCSYVTLDGEWSNGERNGKMNEFVIVPARTLDPVDGYWGVCCYPEYVAVTEYKKDKQTGDAKIYSEGLILYDGELKNGARHGKGVSYYQNGNKKYDGEWINDDYEGKGTLYDETGRKIYSGKWEDGDYAS